MLDYMLDDEEIIFSKKRKKKTLSDLLDKYGSVEGIDKNADVRDTYAYMFANTNNLINEVLAERKASTSQNPPETDDEKDDDLLDIDTNLDTLEPEKEELTKVGSIDRYEEILNLNKKVERANREIKIADNEYAGTKTDASIEKEEIGSISAKYESNNNPKAKGEDNGGSHSYGKYQIETKHGTMLDYIKYLKTKPEYRKYANILNNAGGYEGAKVRTKIFENAWDKLSEDENFNESQHQFLLDKKLKPLINFTNKIKGFNVEKRHPAIKEMLYSLAAQHGNKGSADLLRNAIGMDIANMSDEELVNKVYDERSKVDEYFSSVEKDKRKNIKEKRLPSERRDILRLLNK